MQNWDKIPIYQMLICQIFVEIIVIAMDCKCQIPRIQFLAPAEVSQCSSLIWAGTGDFFG